MFSCQSHKKFPEMMENELEYQFYDNNHRVYVEYLIKLPINNHWVVLKLADIAVL